jgi:hypothetical protein
MKAASLLATRRTSIVQIALVLQAHPAAAVLVAATTTVVDVVPVVVAVGPAAADDAKITTIGKRAVLFEQPAFSFFDILLRMAPTRYPA